MPEQTAPGNRQPGEGEHMAKVTVVKTNGQEVTFEKATVRIYSWRKLHVMETTGEGILLRMIEHGFTDDAWKEVHVYND